MVYSARSLTPNVGGTVRVTYDYAEHGGAVGTISLPVSVPDNAIITGGFIDVITAPTSGGLATIAVQIQSAADLRAATAIASFTGILATVPVGTAATAIKLTAARDVEVVVAVAALTAGKFNIFLHYLLSE